MNADSPDTAQSLAPDNRRQHQRIGTNGATADIVRQEGQVPVRYEIDNLSEGGALLRGPILDPVGTLVGLSVALPGVPLPVPVRAKIVRHQRTDGNEYIAVCFQDAAPLLREAIHELVLMALQAAFAAEA